MVIEPDLAAAPVSVLSVAPEKRTFPAPAAIARTLPALLVESLASQRPTPRIVRVQSGSDVSIRVNVQVFVSAPVSVTLKTACLGFAAFAAPPGIASRHANSIKTPNRSCRTSRHS